MSHLILDTQLIDISRYNLSKQVAKTAAADVYGLRNCDKTWGEVIAKQLIFDVFDCTAFETLNQSEADCLVGKLAEDLVVNNC